MVFPSPCRGSCQHHVHPKARPIHSRHTVRSQDGHTPLEEGVGCGGFPGWPYQVPTVESCTNQGSGGYCTITTWKNFKLLIEHFRFCLESTTVGLPVCIYSWLGACLIVCRLPLAHRRLAPPHLRQPPPSKPRHLQRPPLQRHHRSRCVAFMYLIAQWCCK